MSFSIMFCEKIILYLETYGFQCPHQGQGHNQERGRENRQIHDQTLTAIAASFF